ncbi:MAG: PIG-L family deacetylase [Planctomycetia bacterium]|nr:PIG-L family deacetylase [Planctomycetia bacterium]
MTYNTRFTAGMLVALLAAGLAVPAAEEKLPALDLLIVAPHPDDEAIGCTAIMLQALEQKQRVGVVVMTNGDAFEGVTAVVKKTKDQLVPADYLKLAGARQQHTVGALGRLGVRAADLLFLGYPDGGLDKIYRADGKEPFQQKFTEKKETYGAVVRDYHSQVHGRPTPYLKSSVLGDLQEIIKARQPKEIFVTNETDSHADHRAAFWFVRDAARGAGYRGQLFTFVVHGKGPAEQPGRRLVLTKAQQDRKRAVLEEYQVGLSPFHDNLAARFAKEEEVFWPVPIEK